MSSGMRQPASDRLSDCGCRQPVWGQRGAQRGIGSGRARNAGQPRRLRASGVRSLGAPNPPPAVRSAPTARSDPG